MTSRFTLVLVIVFLLGLGGALYYFSSGDPPAVTPVPTPVAITPPPATESQAAPRPSVTTRPTVSTGRPAHFILAVSWEPAFCETAPSKPECRSMTDGRFDADHFALHGLWPDDDYCGVSDANVAADKAGRWDRLTAPDLSESTATKLDQAMPGTASLLERHEWIKHGSCAGAPADDYFSRALALLAEINASPVRDLFANRIGRSLSQFDIRAAFDSRFGGGAGSRVRVACERDGDRRVVTELTIGLYGDVMGGESLSRLIAAAHPTNGGCESGIVDRVGLQ